MSQAHNTSIGMEEHMNLMIRFAFQKDEAEEVKAFLAQEHENSGDMPTKAEKLEAEKLYANAKTAALEIAKRENRLRMKSRATSATKRIVAIAAYVIVLGLAAVTTAIAVSGDFRSSIAGLLLSMNDANQEVSVSIGHQAQSVPGQEWDGSLYPAYIPDGFSLYEISNEACFISWQSDSEQQIVFTELSSNSLHVSGIQDSQIRTVGSGNGGFYLIASDEDSRAYEFFGSFGETGFSLVVYGLDYDEALKIAESIQLTSQ